jgi:hypothetical protein
MNNKTINNKLKSRQNQRFNVFVLFLFLSFLISLLVKLSNPHTLTIKFQLSPTQLESNELIILNKPKSVDITLNGRGFELLKYYIKKPIIEVDFSLLRKNNCKYFWLKSDQIDRINDHFDSKILVKSITPDSLIFPFDSQFIKKVPVNILVESTFAVGFDLIDEFKSYPDSVFITGPKSTLDTITDISTNQIKLNDINSTIKLLVDLKIPSNLSPLRFSHQSVSIVGRVDKFTEGLVNVPVNIVNIPDSLNINFFPKEVSVSFYSSLKAFSEISKTDFKVECDFNLINNDNNFLYPILVKKPLSIKTAELKINKLEFVITSKYD